jgi:hypothetical protein
MALRLRIVPGVILTGEFTGPPQPDRMRVFRLAQMQARAIFYFLTYDADLRTGRFWRGKFVAVNMALRSDWGNVTMRSFMASVQGWDLSCVGIGASGFFKVAIRKRLDADCWSWAFEWNKNIRAIGFFGDEQAAREIVAGFPPVPVVSVMERENDYLRLRWDSPLAESDDHLFAGPAD